MAEQVLTIFLQYGLSGALNIVLMYYVLRKDKESKEKDSAHHEDRLRYENNILMLGQKQSDLSKELATLWKNEEKD